MGVLTKFCFTTIIKVVILQNCCVILDRFYFSISLFEILYALLTFMDVFTVFLNSGYVLQA